MLHLARAAFDFSRLFAQAVERDDPSAFRMLPQSFPDLSFLELQISVSGQPTHTNDEGFNGGIGYELRQQIQPAAAARPGTVMLSCSPCPAPFFPSQSVIMAGRVPGCALRLPSCLAGCIFMSSFSVPPAER